MLSSQRSTAPWATSVMAAIRQSYGVTDFYPKANEQSLVVVLIKEVEAVNNLQDILTVDNIDIYYMARTEWPAPICPRPWATPGSPIIPRYRWWSTGEWPRFWQRTK